MSLGNTSLCKAVDGNQRKLIVCLPLCTCSFWGKFGEKPSKTQTFTVTSPGELYTIIEDAGNNIHDIRICTDGIVEVDVSKVVEEVIRGSKTDIFIASFTTSWIRLELYKYLELLKNQVLYFDTDSIIYLWREGLPAVETGPFLGRADTRVCHRRSKTLQLHVTNGRHRMQNTRPHPG